MIVYWIWSKIVGVAFKETTDQDLAKVYEDNGHEVTAVSVKD
jgi:hypothetical protein